MTETVDHQADDGPDEGSMTPSLDAAPSRIVRLGPNDLIFHTDPRAPGPFALVEWEMAAPPAPGPPPHRHLDADEACFVLSGRLAMEVRGRPRELGPGGFLTVPKGSWHSLANPGPDRARFLIILTPPGFAR